MYGIEMAKFLLQCVILIFYFQFMKPLLERKRRARINKCLDELKEIMTAALTSQGENVSKLEKADILELTVRHLNKMQQARRLIVSTNRNPLEEIHRFQAGYSSCAQEAASFLLSTPGVDVRVSQRLLSHLSTNVMTSSRSAVALGGPSGPLPQSFPAVASPFGAGIPPVQQPITGSTVLLENGGSLSPTSTSTSTFHSRLLLANGSSISRRRSSGGGSSASAGSLTSPKAAVCSSSASSLPSYSPTSSLTTADGGPPPLPKPRAASLCDTTTSAEIINMSDQKEEGSFDQHIEDTSQEEPEDQHSTKGSPSATHSLRVSITTTSKTTKTTTTNDSKPGNNSSDEIDICSSSSVGETSDTTITASGEIKNIPIKPEPIRLPSLHPAAQQCIADPVWRPF